MGKKNNEKGEGKGGLAVINFMGREGMELGEGREEKEKNP